MNKRGIATIALVSALVLVLFAVSVAPAMAAPTPYVINGYVFYANGSDCNDPAVNVNNTNTSNTWRAENDTTTSYYELVLCTGTDVNASETLRFDAKDPAGAQFDVTEHTITQDEINNGGLFNVNLTLTAAVTQPDHSVSEIKLNCGYIFGNESNEICAIIENIGGEDTGSFNVSFNIIGGFSEEIRISELAAGANTTVCVTDPTLRNAGDTVSITVTADCNAEIDESSETNNASTLATTVVNNGYKGKRYTGGEDIATWKTFELKGNLLYSVGDSSYLSAYSYPDWTTYNVSWNTSDLPVPDTATVKEARLYVPYTWDKKGIMPAYVSMSFNGTAAQTLDAHYSDEKMHATSYPYGMLVYNVTNDFDNSGGNVANLTNSYPGGGNVSIRGMLLVVIYADDSEPKRKIIMNEEFDLLYGGSGKCTTPEEATAYAPFGAIDLTEVKKATLITVAPGAGPNEGELLFNDQTWTDVWNYAGSSQIGINETNVTSYLEPTDNEVGFQSSADYMEASNALLVVEYKKMPDLEITDILCELLREGRKANTYSIYYNITNNGDADALRIISNLTVDRTATKKKSRVKSLAAGSTTNGSFAYRSASATPPNTIKVCADWWDRIVESDETNNCLEVTEVICTVA